MDKSSENHSIEPQTGPVTKPTPSSGGAGEKDGADDTKRKKVAFSPPPVNSPSKSRTRQPPSKRKSNELGRLLDDLTGGIFMTEVRRKPSTDVPPTGAVEDAEEPKPKTTKISTTKASRAHKNRRKSVGDTDGECSSSSSTSDKHDRTKPALTINRIKSESIEHDLEKSSPLKKRKGFRSPVPEPAASTSVDDGDDDEEEDVKPKKATVSLSKKAPISLASALSGTSSGRRSGDKLKKPLKTGAYKLKPKEASPEKSNLDDLLDQFPTVIEGKFVNELINMPIL
jgi:hypothetical protein